MVWIWGDLDWQPAGRPARGKSTQQPAAISMPVVDTATASKMAKRGNELKFCEDDSLAALCVRTPMQATGTTAPV